MTLAMAKSNKDKDSKDLVIKAFVQTICTPVTAEKRRTTISKFFGRNRRLDFDEKECGFIWKGLYYAVWYTEMGKGCEDLIETIVSEIQTSESLLKEAFSSMASEWFGIDAIRLDKIAYFVRRLVATVLTFDSKRIFAPSKEVSPLMPEVLVRIQNCRGLLFHVSSLYIEETLKCIKNGNNRLESEKGTSFLVACLRSFGQLMLTTDDDMTRETIVKDIFEEVINQLDREKVHADVQKAIRNYVLDEINDSAGSKKNINSLKSLQDRLRPLSETKTNRSTKRKKSADISIEKGKRYVRSRVPLPAARPLT